VSRRLLMTALVVFLSGCSLWGGGKKVSPPAPLPELERPIAVDEIWRLDIGAGAKAPYYRLVPGVAGTRLYGATPDGGLLALNAQTGEVIWRVKTHYRFQAGPGFNEQALFLGDTRWTGGGLRCADRRAALADSSHQRGHWGAASAG